MEQKFPHNLIDKRVEVTTPTRRYQGVLKSFEADATECFLKVLRVQGENPEYINVKHIESIKEIS